MRLIIDCCSYILVALSYQVKMLFKNNTFFVENDAVFLFRISNEASSQISKLASYTINDDHKSVIGQAKIYLLIEELTHLESSLQFDRITSKKLSLNLQMIDSKLPEILANVLFYSVKT